MPASSTSAWAISSPVPCATRPNWKGSGPPPTFAARSASLSSSHSSSARSDGVSKGTMARLTEANEVPALALACSSR
ncbi:hypothetical protein ACFPRL_02435 [Pseudoclavibacter helvolus]